MILVTLPTGIPSTATTLPSYRPAALSNWAVTVIGSWPGAQVPPSDANRRNHRNDQGDHDDELALEHAHLQSLKYWIMPNCLARPLIAHIHESMTGTLGALKFDRIAVTGEVGRLAQEDRADLQHVAQQVVVLTDHVGEIAHVVDQRVQARPVVDDDLAQMCRRGLSGTASSRGKRPRARRIGQAGLAPG